MRPRHSIWDGIKSGFPGAAPQAGGAGGAAAPCRRPRRAAALCAQAALPPPAQGNCLALAIVYDIEKSQKTVSASFGDSEPGNQECEQAATQQQASQEWQEYHHQRLVGG